MASCRSIAGLGSKTRCEREIGFGWTREKMNRIWNLGGCGAFVVGVLSISSRDFEVCVTLLRDWAIFFVVLQFVHFLLHHRHLRNLTPSLPMVQITIDSEVMSHHILVLAQKCEQKAFQALHTEFYNGVNASKLLQLPSHSHFSP